MEDFASVVKQARLQKGLTLEGMASRIGSHKGYISGWENHKVSPPSCKIVRKVAKLFGLDVKKLIILAEVEKVDRDVREIMREGSLNLYAARNSGAQPAAAQAAVG